MKRLIRDAAVLAAVGLTSALALSQTPVSPASAPSAVGVTSGTAAEANQKAIPRADTATVVRTAPAVTDRAKAETGSAGSPSTSSQAPVSRPPKADRN